MTRLLVPGEREPNEAKHVWMVTRKAWRMFSAPVPQTDTGRQEENSKANERSVVKELGKLNP